MNNDLTKLYYLASATKRIWIRVLEYLVFIGLNVLIAYLYTFSVIDWSGKTTDYNHWHLSTALLFAFITDFIIWFLYFVCIPFWWKGYTFFYWLFKLKLHTKKENWKFLNFMKREYFLWMTTTFICILLSLVSYAFDDPLKLIAAIGFFNNGQSSTSIDIVAGLFSFLMIANMIVYLGVIINTVVCSNQRSLIDRYSKIDVVDISDSIKHEFKNMSYKRTDLPGQIDEAELDKL